MSLPPSALEPSLSAALPELIARGLVTDIENRRAETACAPHDGVAARLNSQWFAEEVRPHEPALRAYLHSRFPSLRDSDDLVQETYARLLRVREKGAIRSTRALLFVTARNAAHDLFRRKQSIPIDGIANLDQLAVLEDEPSASEVLDRKQKLALLHEAMQALPERCRQVFMLKRIDGLSYEEIGAQLGISRNTISAQITTAMLRCREYLAARGHLNDAL